MSQPWMKFYPSDWRADPALRMCSLSARGLWMEMLCIMHEAEGLLTVNGKQLLPRQLAVLAGATVEEVNGWLLELSDAGVFSRNADGTIYSRRILKDIARSEGDKANGRKGGNPTLKAGVNPPINPTDKGGDKAQKLDTRSQIPEAEKKERNAPEGASSKSKSAEVGHVWPADAFDRWYAEYPHKVGRGAAESAFDKIRRTGKVPFEALTTGVANYRKSKPAHVDWCNPATWLNQERWADSPAETSSKPEHERQRELMRRPGWL